MSRFIFINKKQRFDIEENLKAFAALSEDNPTPEGNWQGDGWGISWVDPYLKWRDYRTFISIWKNTEFMHIFMPSNTFLLHVRTLEVAEEYISEEHNLPYSTDELTFVFDGELTSTEAIKESQLPADRIWEKIKSLNRENLESEFRQLCESIDLEKENLKAANLVLSDKNNLYVYNKYNPEFEYYYQIKFVTNEEKIIFSSQEMSIENLQITDWQKMQNGEYKKVQLFQNLTS